jgi:hypothetical protein
MATHGSGTRLLHFHSLIFLFFFADVMDGYTLSTPIDRSILTSK